MCLGNSQLSLDILRAYESQLQNG
ncbi:MAG: hypothetical protein O4859_13055 [Trichodesmium sp. St18_bin1]|nr:hypothetical protein [Trichodesmium sp. St18_bin1]